MLSYIKKFKRKYDAMSVVAKASLWFVICGFFQRGISTITTPIFSRLLDSSQYGGYTVFNSWLEIVTIVCTLKLGQGVYIQGLVKFDEDQDNFTSSLLGLATVWCGASFAAYLIFRDFWNNLLGLSTYMMICMFVMMISTVGFNFWAAKQRNEYRYVQLVKITILVSILKPLLGIIAILMTQDYKVEARIGSLALVELVSYSFLYFSLLKKSKKFYIPKYWKYALAFNLPLVPHFLSQVILNHSDRIMIQRMVGYSEAGIYSLAYSIAMVLTMLNTSIQNALRPWMFQKIKSGNLSEIKKIGTGALIVVALCNLALISFAPELVSIFAPASYSDATSLIAPITMGVYFAFMYNLFVNVQMYYEKTKSVMIVALICAIINIFTNYIFIGMFGYVAAAYTTLASYILMTIMHYYAMKRIQKKHHENGDIYDIKSLVIITIAFVIAGTIMGLLHNYLTIRLIIVFISIIIVYVNKNKLKPILNLVGKRGTNTR